MSRLKVGVIGAGAWGKNHVRTCALSSEAELVGVCDSSPETRKQLAKQYPGIHLTDDAGDLLGRVEAVIIAAPAKAHAELGLQAIEAGIPALIEKPFALTVRDAEKLADHAEKKGVPLLVGHLLEYHPVVERLRTLITEGTLGEIYYLYAQRVNLGQVRPDENALWSFGPHDVSVALFLLGEGPVRVAAQGHSYLQRGIEDVVFLNMTFASGVIAHVQMSWLDPHKERRLTVVGSKQMAVFDDMAPREKLRIYDKGVNRPPEYRSYGESLTIREGDIFIPRLPNVEPLAVQFQHFVQVVRGQQQPRADKLDGVRVVRVLDAASRSLAAGGAPVSLGDKA
ncbi:MAG TPA: Gfo/Idh/MocA family oxidoreductase [Gemmatimonadales bacterium]|jgi:predicted dehydrogenase|nr:Gfo/Idh/MocA family oxidoreductase [Gemmatimonadales bacterium]